MKPKSRISAARDIARREAALDGGHHMDLDYLVNHEGMSKDDAKIRLELERAESIEQRAKEIRKSPLYQNILDGMLKTPYNTRKNHGVTHAMLENLGYYDLKDIVYGAQIVNLNETVKGNMTPLEILTVYKAFGKIRGAPSQYRPKGIKYRQRNLSNMDFMSMQIPNALSILAGYGFKTNIRGFSSIDKMQKEKGFATKRGEFLQRMEQLTFDDLSSVKYAINGPGIDYESIRYSYRQASKTKEVPIGIFDPNKDTPWEDRNNFVRYKKEILKYC